MKFDVVVGNPPFSKTNAGKTAGKRSKNLYPEFYKKATEMASVVAMVMPDTSNQVNKRHNDFIKKTAYHIEPVSDGMKKSMNVGIEMWTVFYSKDKNSNVARLFAHSGVKKTSTSGFVFNKGKTNISSMKLDVADQASATHQYPIYKAVYKDKPIVGYLTAPTTKTKLPNKGFALLMPLAMADDWEMFVVPCNGEDVNVNVYYVLTDTEAEANDLKDKLHSDAVIAQARSLRGNSNTLTLTALNSLCV